MAMQRSPLCGRLCREAGTIAYKLLISYNSLTTGD